MAARYAQSALTQYSGSHLRRLRDKPPTPGAVWWGEREEGGGGGGGMGATRSILAPTGLAGSLPGSAKRTGATCCEWPSRTKLILYILFQRRSSSSYGGMFVRSTPLPFLRLRCGLGISHIRPEKLMCTAWTSNHMCDGGTDGWGVHIFPSRCWAGGSGDLKRWVWRVL